MRPFLTSFLSGMTVGAVSFIIFSPIPDRKFDMGFTMQVPCDEHGTDIHEVTNTKLIWIYEISMNGEVAGETTEAGINQVLEFIQRDM